MADHTYLTHEAGPVDAVIVGGGPAGLAAAIALRQRGLSCLVVDARQPPIEKSCGEGLMPDGLEALTLLGVELSGRIASAFSGIRFIHGRQQADATFRGRTAWGVRRAELHRAMQRRAVELGAQFAWGRHAALAEDGKVWMDGHRVAARWIIGADGSASQVRQWAGLAAARSGEPRIGFQRHYGVVPWAEQVEVHWGRSGQIYLTPVGPAEVCLVYLSRRRLAAGEDPLREFPQVQARLDGAAQTTVQRGASTVTRRLRRVTRERVALIGDASGSVDAITGEGLAMSFRQALALADSLAGGSLAGYEQAHARIARTPHRMSQALLLMDRWPALRQLGIAALAAQPGLFEALLNAHAGSGRDGSRRLIEAVSGV